MRCSFLAIANGHSKATWARQCQEKLGEIKIMRDKQAMQYTTQYKNYRAQNQQMGQLALPNGQLGMMPNQAPQSGFPHHLQQQMQPSPIPASQPQQMNSGMNGGNFPNNMGMPNNLGARVPNPQNLTGPSPESFTIQENSEINKMAQNMAEKTTPAQLEKIRSNPNLQQWIAAQRQYLQRQKLDPLAYFFRTQAVRAFKMRKTQGQTSMMQPQSQQSQQTQGPSGLGAMDASNANQMLNAQTSMEMQQQRLHQRMINEPYGSLDNFGNFENILGQQQDALRLQEQGELVVPANGQRPGQQQAGGVPGQMSRPQPGQPGNSATPRPGATPNSMAQQQQQQQKAAQMQIQSTAQVRANAAKAQAHQLALQGQPGGMNHQLGQRPNHASPAMPNLNQPLRQSGQQMQPQSTPQQNSQASTSAMGMQPAQQNDSFNGQFGQALNRGNPAMSQGLQNLSNTPSQRLQIPPAVQQDILKKANQLPEPKRRKYILECRARYAQSISKPAPAAARNAQIRLNASIEQPDTGVQASAMFTPNRALQGSPFGQQIPNRQPPPESLAQQPMSRPQPQLSNAQALAPDRLGGMDQTHYPKGILGDQVHVPPEVKTWAQLKEWVAKSRHPDTNHFLAKLEGLQRLHSQHLRDMNQSHGFTVNQGISGQDLGQMSSGASQSSTNAPVNAGQFPAQGPGQVNNPAMFYKPTPQEIQEARARLPPQQQFASDDQIRSWLFRRKQMGAPAASAASQGPGMNPLAAQQMALRNAQEAQDKAIQHQQQLSNGAKAQSSASTAAQPMRAQASQQPSGGYNRNQQAARVGRQGQADPGTGPDSGLSTQHPAKSNKRANDDMVEIQDPNTSNPRQFQPIPGVSQPQPSVQQRGPVPNLTPEQIARLLPHQRLPYEQVMAQAGRQAQANTFQQPAQQAGQQLGTPNTNAKTQAQGQRVANSMQAQMQAKMHSMITEVSSNMAKRPIVAMSSGERVEMRKRLEGCKASLQKFDQGIKLFFSFTSDEKMTKEFLRAVSNCVLILGNSLTAKKRYTIYMQYDNLQGTLVPKKAYTINLDDLMNEMAKLENCIKYVMARRTTLAQQQQEASANTKTNTGPVKPAEASVKPALEKAESQPHPLNAANLDKHTQGFLMQRQQSIQKASTRASNVPPAPTSTKPPPFPSGAASPSRVPYAYGDGGLTQDKLQIPPNKRFKRNQNQKATASTASTPAQDTPPSTSSPQATKTSSPESKRKAISESKKKAEAAAAFKCPTKACNHHTKGFKTEAELKAHQSKVHEPKEAPILDPLAFALESLAEGLGLNKDGTPKIRISPDAAMKTDNATPKPGQTPQGRPMAVPMSRVATQNSTNTKANSPHISKAMAKTSLAGLTGPTDDKTKASLPTTPSSSSDAPTFSNWADSSISQDEILECFAGLETLPGLLSFDVDTTDNALPDFPALFSPPASSSKSPADKERIIDESDQLVINFSNPIDDENNTDYQMWDPFGLDSGEGDGKSLNGGMASMNVDSAAIESSPNVEAAADSGLTTGLDPVDDSVWNMDWDVLFQEPSSGEQDAWGMDGNADAASLNLGFDADLFAVHL
jgi:hypothetical protein